MSTEAKRRRALEGAGSTSTGMREAGAAAEAEEDEGRRPKRPRLGEGGGGGGDGDNDDGEGGLEEEEVEASSPSLPLVRSLSSVADTAVSSSRDRRAAREVEGPRETSGLTTAIGEGRRRVVVGVGVGGVKDASAGERCCCFSAVFLQSSPLPEACRRACDIVSSSEEEEKTDQKNRERRRR